jgi:hypothetical protein
MANIKQLVTLPYSSKIQIYVGTTTVVYCQRGAVKIFDGANTVVARLSSRGMNYYVLTPEVYVNIQLFVLQDRTNDSDTSRPAIITYSRA